MPINASYEFVNAEKKYLLAQTIDEKIAGLEEMIKTAPKHKGSENLLAELKTRLKKLIEKQEKGKKIGKGKKGIKKEGFQVALIGKTNSGKSALLGKLTNANPSVSDVEFSTAEPEIGAMNYDGVKAQIVDLPSINAKNFDFSVANNADCLLFVLDKIEDLKDNENYVPKAVGKKIIVLNKLDLLSENERRKIVDKCRSKRIDVVFVSAKTGEGINDLKKKIFDKMEVIRIYMKEPGKAVSKIPAVLKEGSNVRDVAESIYKGFSEKIKETRLTGPSGKFANQKIGLNHVLKDRDVVEFHTK